MTEAGQYRFGLEVGELRGPEEAGAWQQVAGVRRAPVLHHKHEVERRKRKRLFLSELALGDIFLKQGCPT